MQTRCHGTTVPSCSDFYLETPAGLHAVSATGAECGDCEWMRGFPFSGGMEEGNGGGGPEWNLLFTTSLGWLRVWNIIERTWQGV